MQKFLPFFFILFIATFLLIPVQGQSLDSIRQVAAEGNYPKARELCQARADYDVNTDVKFLEGQTYWWEERISEAKNVFQDVIEQTPEHVGALKYLSHIGIVRENYKKSIRYARRGLQIDNKNEDLLYFMALAQAEAGQLKEAAKELDTLLSINPSHEKGLELKQSLDVFKIPGAITFYQSVQWFTDPYERYLHTTTMEAPIGDKRFKIIPRLNYGILNTPDDEKSGSQAGIDFYPLTGPVSYLYIHYAYSEAMIYPQHRGAAEWFTGIGSGWEISLGSRYLHWDDHIYFFSSSASKYIGKWMPGIRLFYAPDRKNNISGVLNLRRFLNNSNNYIHAYLGYGTNPDRSERQLELQENSEQTRLTGGAYSIIGLGASFYGRLLAEYNMEEKTDGNWRDIFLIQAGIEFKF